MQYIQQQIEEQLKDVISADYVYLELPYYENPGDVLIWEGAEQFLSQLPYKCLYKASLQTFQYQEFSKDTIIILQGGGNFGDIWQGPQQFRKQILQLYPDNRIIILPQTVHYEKWQRMREDAPIFASHKHLTICARDRRSYWLLKLFGMAKSILLVPDMAFCISPETLQQYCHEESDKTLFVKRVDKELGHLPEKNEFDVVQDWPTYMEKDVEVEKLCKMMYLDKCENGLIDEYAQKHLRPHLIRVAVEFISPYRKIYSTRLHACILSLLLGKEVVVVDNSYGKNSSFYYTWLKGSCQIDERSVSGFQYWDVSLFANALLSRIDLLRIKIGAFRRKLC